MFNFFHNKKKEKDKFQQEYLYIEEPIPKYQPMESEQKDKEDRGVIIIELS